MKNLISILFLSVMIFSGLACSKSPADLPDEKINTSLKDALAKASTACGSVNPDQLQWLKDIILKGEEDKETKKYMGMYGGKIFLTSYQNKPLFFIMMPMGSGGIFAYLFDCAGTTVKLSPTDDVLAFSAEAQKGELIYSNVPF
ncbi:MAG TPA: hypothetical protein VLZ28_08230 [Daejeonella sp.]|nr:hypothetical protein [Daejeonella sp.]